MPGYAPLGPDAGIRAGRVDQADDRHLELFSELHLDERFAIALRMGAAEQALGLFLEVVSFLMADQHDAMVADACEAGADGAVVADGAVAVHFDELVEDHVDVIERLWPFRMARDEDGIPRRQVGVDLAHEVGELTANAADFLGGVSPLLVRLAFETGQHRFQFLDFLFERQTGDELGHAIVAPSSTNQGKAIADNLRKNEEGRETQIDWFLIWANEPRP